MQKLNLEKGLDIFYTYVKEKLISKIINTNGMRKIFFFMFLLLSFSSCDNDDSVSEEIAGEWKLIRVEINGFQGHSATDYTNQNVIYNFKRNGKLVVNAENLGYPAGEYSYFFGEDHLGANTDPKTLLVKINDSKFTYYFKDGEMKLGLSYVDGPDLIFVRK